MNRSRFIRLVVLLYLVFLLAMIPARTIQLFLPGHIQLTQIEGSLWSGSAARVVIGQQQLNNVQWQLAWWSVLSNCIGINVQQQQGRDSIAARIGVSWTGKTCIKNIDGDYELARLLQFYPQPLPALGGRVQLDGLGLWLSNGQPVAADGELLWQNATLTMGSTMQLGEYRLSFADAEEADGIDITVVENKGRLDGELRLTLASDHTLRVKGKIRPRNPNDPLRTYLGILGQLDGEGYYVVDRKLVLPH